MEKNAQRLSVLCTTMHRTDFSLAQEMNLCSDAIFANQADREHSEQTEYRGHCVKMLTTTSRGVGVNRNLALGAAQSELLLFSDDDVTYYDGYAEAVVRVFDELPQAQVLVFSMDVTKNGAVVERRAERKRRLHLYNGLSAGACRIAVRRSAVEEQRLSFSEEFGGGCLFSHGEDSLFLVSCFRAGMRVYAHPFVLGSCAKDSSTCFSGYNEKYFYDKGAWLAAAFPRAKQLLKWVFFFKLRRAAELPAALMLRRMRDGIRGYGQRCPFYETPAMEVMRR